MEEGTPGKWLASGANGGRSEGPPKGEQLRLLRGDRPDGADRAGRVCGRPRTKKYAWAVKKCSIGGEPLTETVWKKLMLGLSARKYGQSVREFTEAYGLARQAHGQRTLH